MNVSACCAGRLYYCPQARRLECPLHDGTPCCAYPERHVPLVDVVSAYRPATGPSEPILPLLVQYLTERTEMGTRKYGEPLSTFDGRDPAVDAFEELADEFQYRAQELVERRGSLPPGAGANGEAP